MEVEYCDHIMDYVMFWSREETDEVSLVAGGVEL